MTSADEFSPAFSLAFDAPVVPTSPGYSACGWEPLYLPECDVIATLPPEQVAAIEQAAADLLWNLTNRLFGACPVFVRPCAQTCADGSWTTTFWGRGPYPWAGTAGIGSGPWWPVIVGGKWYNVTCGCVGSCSCAIDGPTALQLPGPVQDIIQVRVDGVVLPPTAYRLDYHRTLIRTDGEVWPSCQDMLATPDQPGTFEVQYTHGIPVPVGGQIALGTLACEMAKAAVHDDTCALPQRLQTITRQGVTVGFVDQFEQLAEGRTGIYVVDAWIASVTAPRPFSAVRSVDVKRNAGKVAWPLT
jgi:hypothetical protein